MTYEQLPPSLKMMINSLYTFSSSETKAVDNTGLVYRLMLYSDYMPKLKKYFTTPLQAIKAVHAHVQKHFPVKAYVTKYKEVGLIAHLDDCYDLLRIDTLRLPDYQKLYPEGTSREGLKQRIMDLENWMKAE